MIIQYLYFLDYPQPGLDASAQVGQVNGINGHLTNGDHTAEDDKSPAATNGDDAHEAQHEPVPAAEDPPAAEHSEALDEFLPIPAATKPKHKKRKKKKAATKPDEEEGQTEVAGDAEETAPAAPEDAMPADGETEAAPPKADETEAAEEAADAPAVANPGFLAVHAKVYGLSKKYGIEGLRALALDKFEGEAVHQWATEDFLLAAREVYSSSLVGEADDRRMKDMITDIVFQHPAILDSPETQTAIRGLGLADDVLMRVRKQVWKS